MIFTQSQFKSKISALEAELTSLGGVVPAQGKHTMFGQDSWKKKVSALEELVAARKAPARPSESGGIMNMSDQQMDRFETLTEANKSAGVKNPTLAALASVMQQAEPSPAARPTATVRPAPAQRPVARPAPTPPPAPAPAPAGTMPTAAAIACAMLDETARRAAASLVKSRAQFSALTPRQQSDFCKAGGRITV